MRALAGFLAGIVFTGASAAEVEPTPLRLRVELTDGSRIIGQPVTGQFVCEMEFGTIRAGWERVKLVEFKSGSNHCVLRLVNGDQITARYDFKQLSLDTLLGKLAVPAREVVRIEVLHPRRLPDGLVLHYSFDDVKDNRVPDQSGADHHGRMTETTLVSRQGQSPAVEWDGRQGGILVGNAPKLRLQDFTIACWVRRADVQKASHHQDGGLIAGHAVGGICFAIFKDGQPVLSQAYGEIAQRASPEFRLSDTEWHHLAVTKQGQEVAFYLNGVAHKSAGLRAVFTFDSPFSIGGGGAELRNTFLGSLDEVMMFDRGLNADEIKVLIEKTR